MKEYNKNGLYMDEAIKVNESYYSFKPINNPIILDLAKCTYLGEIHNLLKENFGLPDYYGENWDALWDCLDGRFVGKESWIVEIYGLSYLSENLREECELLINILDKISKKVQDFVVTIIE